jgi:hypothetical protein
VAINTHRKGFRTQQASSVGSWSNNNMPLFRGWLLHNMDWKQKTISGDKLLVNSDFPLLILVVVK